MSDVGQPERATQNRVVALFQSSALEWDYLGNWIARPDNRNIEEQRLRASLKGRGVDPVLINRALSVLTKATTDQSRSLYDVNRTVYDLLRYGVKVKREAGANAETVSLIDWRQPLNNHFAIAEEVTVSATNAKADAKRPDIVLYVNGIALVLQSVPIGLGSLFPV